MKEAIYVVRGMTDVLSVLREPPRENSTTAVALALASATTS